MTDLTTTITELTQQAGQLLDLPQQIANTAEARINAIGSYYQQRLATMELIAYVDQATGDDQAAGDSSAPLRSIDEALRRTPPGGICNVYLAADYHVQTSVAVRNRLLIMRSATSARRQLTFQTSIYEEGATQYRVLAGIELQQWASIDLVGVDIQMPDATAAGLASYQPHPTRAGIVQMTGSTYVCGHHVIVRYCDITMPATPVGALISGWAAPLELYMSALTVDGPLTGHIHSQVNDAAGTDTTTLPWLTTNLAQI